MDKNEFYQRYSDGELESKSISSYEETVNPHNIIGDRDWNPDHPHFWTHHNNTKEYWLNRVDSGQTDNSPPIKVQKCGDKYVIEDDGNHRVAAAKELNRPVKVEVVGKYTESGQARFNSSVKATAASAGNNNAAAFNESAKGYSSYPASRNRGNAPSRLMSR